eukprot:gene19140-biopygen19406
MFWMTFTYRTYSFSSNPSCFSIWTRPGYWWTGMPKSSSPAWNVVQDRLWSSKSRWNFLSRSMASAGEIPSHMGPARSNSSRHSRTVFPKPSTSRVSRALKPCCSLAMSSPRFAAIPRRFLQWCHSSPTCSSSSFGMCTSFALSISYISWTGPKSKSTWDSRSLTERRVCIIMRRSSKLSDWFRACSSALLSSTICAWIRERSRLACWWRLRAYCAFHACASFFNAALSREVSRQSEPITYVLCTESTSASTALYFFSSISNIASVGLRLKKVSYASCLTESHRYSYRLKESR